MTKFQYLVTPLDTSDPVRATTSLKEFGADGWELVSVIPITDYNGEKSLFYFKRPISN